MNDLISRQAAIDSLYPIRCNLQMMDDTYTADKVIHGLWLAENALKQLPSAERRGRWIEDDDEIIRGHCSACGWTAIWQETDVYGSNFCPNCGAKMERRADDDR